MLIFISYSRVNQTVCKHIIDHLPGYSVWYDNMLVALEDWWPQIERMIDRCDVFVNLVSYQWLKSDYCQDEYEIARRLEKIIINILVEPVAPEDMPESVRNQQYIDMTMGLTIGNLAHLNLALTQAQQWLDQYGFSSQFEQVPAPPRPQAQRKPQQATRTDPLDTLRQAAQYINSQRFEDALLELRKLETVRPEQNPWLYNKVQLFIRHAERGLAQMQKRDEISRRNRLYDFIIEELRGRETRSQGIEDFRQFHRRYPDYDPLNVAPRLFKSNGRSGSGPRQVVSTSIAMLEFRYVRGGNVLLKVGQGSTDGDYSQVAVADFYLATYPFTNDQARLWYTDPEGYNNLDWWSFSPFALEWRRMNPTPTPMKPRFDGPFQPRTGVTWYEAMAIAAWLSAQLRYTVTLPTRAQRVRAARGDEARPFPWIGEFSTEYANTEESRLGAPTDVTIYELGVSAFTGVADLCGNIWEWCRDNAHGIADVTSNHYRSMHGGSYKSPTERAKLDFFYAIPPVNSADNIGFRIAVEAQGGERR